MYLQGLDGLQRSKEPLADRLQLVVIQREQVEVLQVLEGVHPQTVDLVGVEEAAGRRDALVTASGARAGYTCCDHWKVAIPHPCGLEFLPQPREREATSGGFLDPPHFAPITMDAVLHVLTPPVPGLVLQPRRKVGSRAQNYIFFSALECRASRNQKE